MANRRHAGQLNRQPYYIYGNTVRQAEVMPQPEQEQPVRMPKKRASVQVRRNRRNAMHMSQGYVVFLSIAAILVLTVCVSYLKLQNEAVTRSETIAAMQQELAAQKEENTTRYNALMDKINLNDIRTKAMNELGMVYASKDQIISYESPTNDYVKQYETIPDSGVVARAEKAEK